MNIPIVTGKRAFAYQGLSDKAGKKPGRFSVPGSKQDSETDAVKLSLSGKTQEAVNTKNISAQQGVLKQDGSLPALIQSLRDISEHISTLEGDLGHGSVEQDLAKNKEIDALKKQLLEIAKSPVVKEITELTGGVAALIKSGGSLAAIAKALSSQSSIVGSNFIDLVSQGALSNLSDVQSFVESISQLSANSDLESFSNRANSALSSLSSTQAYIPLTQKIIAESASEDGIPLEARTSKFDLGGDFALTVKGYGSRDLIKAAATGAIKDISQINQITIETKASKQEKEQERKKQLEPQNSGAGINIQA